MIDMGQKYGSVAPGDTVLCDARLVEVLQVVIYRPGQHPDSPIADNMHAVEAITVTGSRWAGGEQASIQGDLRAHWARS